MTTQIRIATPADEPVVVAVYEAFDTAWFGRPEHDADEVHELFETTDQIVLVEHDGAVVAFAGVWPQGAEVVGDPAAPLELVYPVLVTWLGEQGCPEIEALERDERLLAVLEAAGWPYSHSTYELDRPLAELELAAPQWPAGVRVGPAGESDLAGVHRLIYADAGWAEITGHHARTLAEWITVFVEPLPDPPLVVWRGDTPVGAAVRRTFSTGVGWISQLAVARGERGNGLGRALLLEAFGELAGRPDVSSLGLSVIADNRKALDLYLSVGLLVRDEWQAYDAPAS